MLNFPCFSRQTRLQAGSLGESIVASTLCSSGSSAGETFFFKLLLWLRLGFDGCVLAVILLALAASTALLPFGEELICKL